MPPEARLSYKTIFSLQTGVLSIEVWAVTEKVKDYVMGPHFTVLRDNNPLTHILTSAKLDATGQRWASALGKCIFYIIYRTGLKNIDADSMSRYPYDKVSQEEVKLEDHTVKLYADV